MSAAAGVAVDFTGSIFLSSSNVNVSANRLNWRAEVLIAHNPSAFVGKRVLDLASHDGRFTHAALACGANHVVGVEARAEHVDKAFSNMERLGHPRERYEFVVGDLVDYLRPVQPGSFDTILCFGIFSHLIEQVEILREIRRIAPEHFILDTWVAKQKFNLVERMRNHRVNTFVGVTQQGRQAKKRTLTNMFQWFREYTTSSYYRTGTMVFLYEDSDAAGATIRKSGLMAWTTRSVVDMLFDHYGFDHSLVDWRSQNIPDWNHLEDYRKGDRDSWIARLPRQHLPRPAT
jgi:ubiquinone/menaquinone biosynthesis C-methylase UbiE